MRKILLTGDCKGAVFALMKNNKRFFVLLILAGVFFFSLLIKFGIGMYNDSEQYIAMHIHRDPGYPMFLWVLRQISEAHYLLFAGVIQAMLATWCTAKFTDYIAQQFDLKIISTIVVLLFTLTPHIVTPLFAESGLILTNGIMSEALCLPLFLLFVKELHRAVTDNSKKAIINSFVFSLVISLIRAQLMATIVIWLVVLLLYFTFKKTYSRILLCILAVGVFFGGRLLITKTYNYCVHGEFINTTYGEINTLTNILYASDREQGEDIENSELRDIYYELYDLMTEIECNYKYTDDNVIARAHYLESVHDTLKFDVCEEGLKGYVKRLGVKGYVPRDIRANEYAGELIKELFPGCAGRWFSHYLVLGMWGAIRNIAIVHPILSVYAIVAGVVAIVMTFLFFKKKKESKEAWLMLIALLSIAGIAFSTAYTIMCLSRYMVYGFTGFYTAAYAMLLALIRNYKKKVKEV